MFILTCVCCHVTGPRAGHVGSDAGGTTLLPAVPVRPGGNPAVRTDQVGFRLYALTAGSVG